MTNGIHAFTCASALATVLIAVPAAAQMAAASAQPATIQTTLANDLGNLSDKFTGLARVMAGKYDWRPMPGVRSVADVFNLIVGENRMLANLLTGAAGQGRGGMGGGTPITDPAQMQEALKSSYATLRDAISKLSDSDWNTSVQLFGQQTTKRGAALMLLMDQHEHLGQSIAYARSNSIVPPWSK
jgi:hypothetical protein